MTNKGSLIVFTGPSGVGKGTVLKALRSLGQDFFFSVSATTRTPRPGETDGVNYYFLTKTDFESRITDNAFLEYASYAGNYYGTPKAPIESKLDAGIDVMLEIELQGARQVMKTFPEAVTVFLLPPSLEELERRLRGRQTESEADIQKRISAAKGECDASCEFQYQIINDQPEAAAKRLQAIMVASRYRTR